MAVRLRRHCHGPHETHGQRFGQSRRKQQHGACDLGSVKKVVNELLAEGGRYQLSELSVVKAAYNTTSLQTMVKWKKWLLFQSEKL